MYWEISKLCYLFLPTTLPYLPYYDEIAVQKELRRAYNLIKSSIYTDLPHIGLVKVSRAVLYVTKILHIDKHTVVTFSSSL